MDEGTRIVVIVVATIIIMVIGYLLKKRLSKSRAKAGPTEPTESEMQQS